MWFEGTVEILAMLRYRVWLPSYRVIVCCGLPGMHVKQELVRNESTQIILHLCLYGFPQCSLMSVVNTIFSPIMSNNLINIEKEGRQNL